MKKICSKIIFCFLIVILLIPLSAFSQDIPTGGGGGRIEGSFKFLPIPYINYDRSIGFTLGGLPMALFNPVKSDTLSPSSIAGLLGMYTTNNTWFFMGFTKMYFDEDNWRFTAAGGLGSVNFQFYLNNPINTWIPYNTSLDFVSLEVLRRVYDKIYIGVSYNYLKFNTKTDSLPDTQVDILRGFGLKLTMDRRTNVYYPTNGFQTNIKYFTYPESFGNEFASNKVEVDYNHYFPMRGEQDVLAGRFFAGLGFGDLSFNQQFIVGQNDIRGYTKGAFRGNYMIAIQGEYRWNFANHWGLVGFLGFASVFESINKEDDGKILPGVGTGIRFTAFTDNHMNVGIDIAAGDSDWGVYFRVGEAF